MDLIETPSFIRSFKSIYKRYPERINEIRMSLELLSLNPFNEILKTHKLKGKLKGSYSCSVSYNLRIVFQIVKIKKHGKISDAILLEAIGTHDEVY